MGIVADGFKRIAESEVLDALQTRAGRCAHLAKMTFLYLAKYGPRYTAKRTMRFVEKRLRRSQSYSEWLRRHAYTQEQLALQRAHTFEKDTTFSVIVPLHNTHIAYLRKMIESVQAQTYGNWELCMADGSDAEHAKVSEVCREYAESDARIRYKKLASNYGISGNTNECLKMARGEYVALLDDDDILLPAALFRMMQVVDARGPDLIYTDEATFLSPSPRNVTLIHFKPDFAIDDLRASNYLCHLTAYRRELLDEVGPYRSQCDGSQDHDMMLRIAAVTDNIAHIPEVLYLWRAHPGSAAFRLSAKSGAPAAGRRAVRDSLDARGIDAEVESDRRSAALYRVRYALEGAPKVSIVIPAGGDTRSLGRCLESIEGLSTYANYEVVLVADGGAGDEALACCREAQDRWQNVSVVCRQGPRGWSAASNLGVGAATGEHFLLLSGDARVITPSWIEEMLMYAQRGDVGAVGAKLYHADGTVRHAGAVIGLGGKPSGHVFAGLAREEPGYMGRLRHARDVSAVAGACVMVRRDVWDRVGGADERFAARYGDVDLCLRIRREGYLVVWTPHAELYHLEPAGGGPDGAPEKEGRAGRDEELFWGRWAEDYGRGDPYYSPNLSLLHSDSRPRGDDEGAPPRRMV